MLAKNLKPATDYVLKHEGGYVNHPKDPGGATNYGVIQRTYDAYRKKKGLPTRSVRNITMDEVVEIYDKQYWDAVKGDDLPSGVDYVVYDGGVNSGPKQSIKWLQRALQPTYTGKIDGVVGLQTLEALNQVADHDALIERILDRRMAFLRALKTWKTFGKGWTSRVNGVRSVGQSWARNEYPDPSVIIDGAGSEKATIEDAKKPPAKGPADAATGGGVAGGGIAGTINELQDQLTPLSAAGEWITTVVAILAVASAVLVIGGLAYRTWAKRRERKLADALDLEAA